MDRSARLERRRSKRWIWSLAVTVVMAIAVVLFLRNNPELFPKTKPAAVSAVPVSAPTTPVGDRNSAAAAAEAPQAVRQAETAQPAAPPTVDAERGGGAEGAYRSIVISDIDCRSMDRPDLRIMIAVELMFDDDSLKDEILVKREGLKVVVRKAVSRLSIGEVQTSALQAALLNDLGVLLDHGKLRSVLVRDLRMEKATRS